MPKVTKIIATKIIARNYNTNKLIQFFGILYMLQMQKSSVSLRSVLA
jgi:hypothetical protein